MTTIYTRTIDTFAVGDAIIFAATKRTLAHGLVNKHGIVRAVRYQHDCSGDLPRYDIETDVLGHRLVKVHPGHLIKDTIA